MESHPLSKEMIDAPENHSCQCSSKPHLRADEGVSTELVALLPVVMRRIRQSKMKENTQSIRHEAKPVLKRKCAWRPSWLDAVFVNTLPPDPTS